MSFVTRLRPELIAIAPPWHGFRDTAAGLVGMLVGANAIPAAQEPDAVRAVIAREHEASTAVSVGVASARLGGPRDRRLPRHLARRLYSPFHRRMRSASCCRRRARQLSPPGAGGDRDAAALAGAPRGPAQRAGRAGRAPGPRSPRALGASRVTASHVRRFLPRGVTAGSMVAWARRTEPGPSRPRSSCCVTWWRRRAGGCRRIWCR